MTDEERVVRAIRQAQLILANYSERGSGELSATVDELVLILTSVDVIESTDRLEVVLGLRSS
jgi:hypothetical protein